MAQRFDAARRRLQGDPVSLRESAAEQSSQQQSHNNRRPGPNVDVPGAVVLQEGEQTRRWQQDCEGCTLRSFLIHTEKIDEGRHNDDATTNAHESGKNTCDET